MNSRMSDDEIFVNKDFMCLRALAARPDVVLQLHEERWVVEEPVRFQQLFRPSCVGAYVYQMACKQLIFDLFALLPRLPIKNNHDF